MELQPTAAQAARGWVVRPSTFRSDAVLARGARKGDDEADYRRGFVYAETPEAAEAYDIEFNYTGGDA